VGRWPGNVLGQPCQGWGKSPKACTGAEQKGKNPRSVRRQACSRRQAQRGLPESTRVLDLVIINRKRTISLNRCAETRERVTSQRVRRNEKGSGFKKTTTKFKKESKTPWAVGPATFWASPGGKKRRPKRSRGPKRKARTIAQLQNKLEERGELHEVFLSPEGS
jgi:hypothetical protein